MRFELLYLSSLVPFSQQSLLTSLPPHLLVLILTLAVMLAARQARPQSEDPLWKMTVE